MKALLARESGRVSGGLRACGGFATLANRSRALSSAEERCLHTAEVTGSIPVAPTTRIPCKHRGFLHSRIFNRATRSVRCPSGVRRRSGSELAGLSRSTSSRRQVSVVRRLADPSVPDVACRLPGPRTGPWVANRRGSRSGQPSIVGLLDLAGKIKDSVAEVCDAVSLFSTVHPSPRVVDPVSAMCPGLKLVWLSRGLCCAGIWAR